MLKTILVTGASRGLGRDIAEYYSKMGNIVINLSRNKSNITGVIDYTVDISDLQQLKEVFSDISSKYKIDILINNAAVFKKSNFTDMDDDDIQSILDINLKGTIFVTKKSLALMSSGSTIVFINSVAGLRSIDGESMYCVSKHGLKVFADILGKELRSEGIKVSSIHPGGINTSLWNAENPYPGENVKDALPTQSIIDLIEIIVTNKYGIEYKSINIFPTCEWH